MAALGEWLVGGGGKPEELTRAADGDTRMMDGMGGQVAVLIKNIKICFDGRGAATADLFSVYCTATSRCAQQMDRALQM